MLSTIMIIAILIIRKLFSKKLHIEILSFLWLLVILRLAVPITPEIGIHADSIIPAFRSDIIVATDTAAHQEEPETNYTTDLPGSSPEAAPNTPKAHETNTNASQQLSVWDKLTTYYDKLNIIMYLSYIWAAGVLITLFIKMYTIIRFKKKIVRSTPINNAEILQMMESNRKLIKLRRKVTIQECPYIDAPATYGIINPKIILPFGFINTLPKDKQNLIILHELYHIKKIDVAKNYLWLMAAILYWFNPLVPYAHSKYINDTELHCDTLVLRAFKDDKCRLYSQSLLDVVKLSNGEIKLPIALSFCEDRSNLRKRVENMIKPTKKLKGVSIAAIFAAAIISIACFTTACLPVAGLDASVSEPTESTHIEFEAQPSEYVKIFVDADLDMPVEKTIDLVRVVPKNISNEQLDSFIEYVSNNGDMFSNGDIKVMSSGETTRIDGDLNSENSITTYTEISASTNDNKDSFLELTQSDNELDSQLAYWRFDDGYQLGKPSDYTGSDIKGMKKSYDDCLEIANNLIQAMDGAESNYTLNKVFSYSDSSYPMYRFFFYREYYGILSSPASLLEGEENHYTYSNFANIFVDDEGIFEVWWLNNIEKPEIIENDVAFLDPAEIINKFEKYIKNNFYWNSGENAQPNLGASATLNINSARLNVVMIPDDQDAASYIATPVWEFIGNMEFDEPVNLEGNYEMTEQQDVCIIRINALDGKIIP